MTCYRSRDNWHSYVKNSLNEAELVGMSTHLSHCSECRDIVSVIQETAGIFAKSRVIIAPPAAIKINVMMAIEENRYKKVSASHLFESKNWGFSMVAAGLLLFALNFTSLTPNFERGQVSEFNVQIGKQIAHPFDQMSKEAYAVIVKIETIIKTPKK